MPLGILLAMVVGGIAAIAGLLHVLGCSRRFDIADDGIALREWARHRDGDVVAQVLLSGDRHSALVLTDRGPGLLWAFGADTVAMPVRAASPVAGGLRFDFGAFEAPTRQVRLSDTDLPLWRSALGLDERAEA